LIRPPPEILKMRKTLWIMLAVLLVAISAPKAHADSTTDYTLSFTLTDGSLNAASVGTVIFDNTTGEFNTLNVVWNGVKYSFIGIDSSGISTTGSWSACAALQNPPDCDFHNNVAVFDLGGMVLANPPGGTTVNATADGSYVLTPVGAPEPSSVALMLLGVGLVLVMRKRIGQSLPLAS
jgi:hypothetical protein